MTMSRYFKAKKILYWYGAPFQHLHLAQDHFGFYNKPSQTLLTLSAGSKTQQALKLLV